MDERSVIRDLRDIEWRAGEKVCVYSIGGISWACKAIAPEDFDDTGDLGGVLEDTLHRLIDAGATEYDIRRIMGLQKFDYDTPEACKSTMEIDLGYGYDLEDGGIVSMETQERYAPLNVAEIFAKLTTLRASCAPDVSREGEATKVVFLSQDPLAVDVLGRLCHDNSAEATAELDIEYSVEDKRLIVRDRISGEVQDRRLVDMLNGTFNLSRLAEYYIEENGGYFDRNSETFHSKDRTMSKKLIGISVYGDVVFADLLKGGVIPDANTAFSIAYPTHESDFDKSRVYAKHIQNLPEAEAFEMCKRFDCSPSKLADALMRDHERTGYDGFCALHPYHAYPNIVTIGEDRWAFMDQERVDPCIKEEEFAYLVDPDAYADLLDLMDTRCGWTLAEAPNYVQERFSEIEDSFPDVEKDRAEVEALLSGFIRDFCYDNGELVRSDHRVCRRVQRDLGDRIAQHQKPEHNASPSLAQVSKEAQEAHSEAQEAPSAQRRSKREER